MKKFLAVAMLAALPMFSHAQIREQNIPVACGPFDDVLRAMERYKEVPVWNSGEYLFTMNGQTGTWSMFQVPRDNYVCLIASGTNMNAAPTGRRL